MALTRYLLIGGFLGAGKTTAMLRLAEKLTSRGLRVGLITNDQSTGLVDTALLAGQGHATGEVTGGCFCCKFNSLLEASEQLAEQTGPDVFLAEPVGSCTDLKATVAYPLRRLYGEQYRVAPLSVLVDPLRARRILGLDTGNAFSPKVEYIYRKQLEEAEVLVINKCDLLAPAELALLDAALRSEYPGRMVLQVSAREGTGIDEWLDYLWHHDLGRQAAMDVDYDTYAEGEALLGWLNATVRLTSDTEFDGNAYVARLGEDLRAALAAAGAEVAHLKMTLAPAGVGRDLAVANLVRAERAMELAYQLVAPLERGTLLLNLRAEAAPEVLRQLVEEQLARPCEATASVEQIAAFRPGRPTPTHRLAEA